MKTTKALFSKLEKARQEKTLEIFINHPNLNISLMQTDPCNNYFGNLPVSLRETFRSDISFAKPITPGELCFKLILEVLIGKFVELIVQFTSCFANLPPIES